MHITTGQQPLPATTRESLGPATRTQRGQRFKKKETETDVVKWLPLGWASWWLSWDKDHSIWHSSLCFSASVHISQPWLFSVRAPLHVLPCSYCTDPGPQRRGGMAGHGHSAHLLTTGWVSRLHVLTRQSWLQTAAPGRPRPWEAVWASEGV